MSKIIIILILLLIYSCSFNSFPIGNGAITEPNAKEKELFSKAIEFKNTNKFSEAIKIYKSIIDINPNNIEALYQLTKTYYLLENYEKALEYSIDGMEFNSNYRINFILQTELCLIALNKSDKIEELYKEAIENSALNNKDDFLQTMYINLAKFYSVRLNYKESESLLIKGIKINKFNPNNHYELTKVYIAQNRMFEALFSSWFYLINQPSSKKAYKLIKDMDYFVNPIRFQNQSNLTGNNTITINNSIVNKFTAWKIVWDATKETIISNQVNLREKEFKNIIELFNVITELNIYSKSKETDKELDIKNFTIEYYFPFIKRIKEEGFFIPMLYYAYSSSEYNGVEQWLDNNSSNYQIEKFLKWYNHQ